MKKSTIKCFLVAVMAMVSNLSYGQSDPYVYKTIGKALDMYPDSLMGRNESCILLLKFVKSGGKNTMIVMNEAPPKFLAWINNRLKTIKSFDYRKVSHNDVLPIVLLGAFIEKEDYLESKISINNLWGSYKNVEGCRFLKPMKIIEPMIGVINN
jgi:hypothetical protein